MAIEPHGASTDRADAAAAAGFPAPPMPGVMTLGRRQGPALEQFPSLLATGGLPDLAALLPALRVFHGGEAQHRLGHDARA